jgi:hypothetical protein
MAEKQKDSNIEAYLEPMQAQIDELRDAVTVCVHLLEGVSVEMAAHPELQRIKALLGA